MGWWTNYPWRMVQTNLREIDMADIDAKNYAQELADFGATVVTLNAGGILASYHSKLPYQKVSEYLTGSSLKEMVESCHDKGIKVIARMDFSKVPVAVYEQHPDWAFRTADGGIIEQNGFVQTCQNSEYQQEKVLEILEEVLTTHPFDGVYCNMSSFFAVDYSGKVHGMCTCQRCKAGFKAAFNTDAPTKLDMRDPVCMRYMGFQSGSGKKLREKMNTAIKGINPDIAVDKVDYLRSESHTDIDIPIWIHSASSNSRQVAGGNRTMISDNASADYMGFRYRESCISPKILELRQWQNLANAGSVSLYLLGTLGNHRDRTSINASKKVFQFHKEHENVIAGLQSAAQVLLAVKNQQGRSDEESFGWIRALTASHIPFDEVKTGGVTEENLAGKKLLILADVNDMNPEQFALVDAFANQGGIVIATSGCGMRGGDASGMKCLGIDKILEKKNKLMSSVYILDEKDADTFTRCATAPVIAAGSSMVIAQYEDQVQRFFHTEEEPMFGPPEVCYATVETRNPGLTVNTFGEGKGIFIPWNCGSFYYNEGYTNTLNYMQDLLFEICKVPQIAKRLHPSVELVLSKKENTTVVSLINASGYFANSFYDAIPMSNIELELPGEYAQGEGLHGGRVMLEAAEGKTKITLDALVTFEMIVLEAK